MTTTQTRRPLRVNLNTTSLTRNATLIGRTTTVSLYDGKQTGTIEKIVNGRAVVRFPEGGWAYSNSSITIR